MGVSPSVGAGFPTREGCSGLAGSMTNMDIVSSPALVMKRNCMIVSKLKSKGKERSLRFQRLQLSLGKGQIDWLAPYRLSQFVRDLTMSHQRLRCGEQ